VCKLPEIFVVRVILLALIYLYSLRKFHCFSIQNLLPSSLLKPIGTAFCSSNFDELCTYITLSPVADQYLFLDNHCALRTPYMFDWCMWKSFKSKKCSHWQRALWFVFCCCEQSPSSHPCFPRHPAVCASEQWYVHVNLLLLSLSGTAL